MRQEILPGNLSKGKTGYNTSSIENRTWQAK